MIVGIVLVLMLQGLHAVLKEWLDDLKSARHALLALNTPEDQPVLRREVIVKNPLKNK